MNSGSRNSMEAPTDILQIPWKLQLRQSCKFHGNTNQFLQIPWKGKLSFCNFHGNANSISANSMETQTQFLQILWKHKLRLYTFHANLDFENSIETPTYTLRKTLFLTGGVLTDSMYRAIRGTILGYKYLTYFAL